VLPADGVEAARGRPGRWLLFQEWDFNIRRSLAGVLLPKCAGDHMDNEEQEDKEKRAPTQTRHNGSGSLFIHFFWVSLILVLFMLR
jgi:hypothetical protein